MAITEVNLIIAFANFVIYFAVSLFIGGTAFYGGMNHQGEYFIRMGMADRPVSVAEIVYKYSLYHGYGVILTFVIAGILMVGNAWVWKGVKSRPTFALRYFKEIALILVAFMAIVIISLVALSVVY